MHTSTSKQILSPLAEAVFQLILIVSEAEISKTPIPDLSQLAKIVDQQIENLVNVGNKIQNQQNADEKIKTDMPSACQEGKATRFLLNLNFYLVTSSSTLLLSGTLELSKNPFSRPGQLQLLESVKGILHGTTNVLFAFDNFEIRKIINCARLCQSKTTLIKTDEGKLPQQLVQILMQTSQIVVQLAQLTNKRINELLSPIMQYRLKIAVAGLQKESPLLISSSKAYLQTPGNQNAKISRDQSCNRLFDICTEIIIVVLLNPEEDSASNEDRNFELMQRNLDDSSNALLDAFKKGEVKIASESLQMIENSSKSLNECANDYWQNAKYPEYKKNLRNYLDNAKIHEDEFKGLSTQLLQDPTNKEKTSELEKALSDFERCWALIAATHQKDKASLKKLQGDLEKNGKNLVDELKNQNVAGVKESLNDYKSLAKCFKDSKRKIKILETIVEIAGADDEIAKLVGLNPKDETVVKEISNRIENSNKKKLNLNDELIKGLIGGLSTATDDVCNHKKPETALGSYFACATNDSKEAEKAEKKFVNSSNNLSNIIEKVIDAARETSPDLSLTLFVAQQKLQNLKPSVVTALNAVSMNPKDEGVKEFAKGLLGSWEDNIKDIVISTISQAGIFKTTDLINGTKSELDEQIEILRKAIEEKDAAGIKTGTKSANASAELNDKMFLSFENTGMFDAKENENLFAAIKSLTSKIESLGFEIKKYHGEEPVAIENTGSTSKIDKVSESKIGEMAPVKEHSENAEVVIEEAPQLLSKEEAIANPIKAVAQELKVEVSQWSTKGNSIVSSAEEVSNFLIELSKFHQELKFNPTGESKKGFINAAKEIVNHTGNVVNPARILANSCTDLRLKKNLLGTLDKITTLSQQLKIVAAVKASSPQDTDRDLQLIGCAQNLMMALKASLRECDTITTSKKYVINSEQGGLKSTPANAVSDLTFRRKVYKGVTH
ncbi:hypothetical protein HK099_007090 [Clydaea vesicula]|uniref:Uncharacterized protein n=1 Tax=Clydaea vesicula TaxID=447962 RepID=A0AAD5U5M0_9FUNG|nr:hypothetical protein HK099_007090 [Clydaea vesicula]